MKKKIIKIGFAIIIVLFSSFHLFAQANQQIKFELVNSNLTAKDNDGKDIDFSTYQVKAGKDLVVSLHSDNNIKDLFITISYKNPQNNNTEIDTIKAKTTDLNNGTYSISTTVLKTINENLIIIFFNKNNTSLGKYTIKIDHSLTNVTDNNPAPKPTTSKATGIMFYDAELLKNNKDGSNPEIVLDILSTYTGKKLKIADLDASFQNNTFLKEFIKHYLEEYNKTTQAHAGIEGSISKVSSAISSFDVTTYANALSDIMIQHAKEELTVAFFNRFQKFAANNPEFQVLFPKTTNNLSNLLTYSYPQMLPALRSGFHEDLEQIAYHIDDVLELPKYAELLKNFPEVRVAIRSIRLVHDLETGASNAADIIKEFSEIEDWKDSSASLEFKNMANSVKLAAIFSESVRNDSFHFLIDSTIWVQAKKMKELYKNPLLAEIYTGLLYESSKEITFYLKDGSTKKFTDILSNNSNTIMLIQNKVSEFITLANKVDNSFKDVKKKIPSKQVSNEDIYTYINVSIDVVDYAFSIAKIFDKDLITDDYLALVRKSNDLYRSIYKQEYSQIANDAVDILSEIGTLLDKNNSEIKVITNAEGKIKDATKLSEMGKTKALIASYGTTLNKSKNSFSQLTKFLEKLKPYALFMANMVTAKTEEEVKAALDDVVLPVGSSSMKKYSTFNIAVQSYLGARYNTYSNNSVQNTWNDSWGVIAPVGISFNFGLRRFGSLSLFGSLLDIGAIVDYKLTKADSAGKTTSTTTGKEYKVELGQIFSPGGYIVYGLPINIPLSIGFGGQYGPGLSKITTANNTVLSDPYWRWNVFFSVDIPLINILNVSQHKKLKYAK